ncbi:MAG: TonB-dependent receptor, partial [Ginsengibacter sp.]
MSRILFLVFLFIAQISQAQVKIKGKITDHKNRPIMGISISIKDSYDGATSDSLGNYSFSTSEKGAQILIASSSEYNEVNQPILIENANLEVNFVLKEKITQLNAVVISVGTFAAGDQKKGTMLTSLDVVTTASANGDITNAFKTVPGTQQVGESEGLFVRGGTAAETKFFIDGSLVNDFFYASQPGMATRGRFNPFLFKGTTFSSGGYSALYGQALSSVLLMESIDLPDKTSADFGFSYLGANAGIQKLSKDKKSSWGVTYSYTNLALVYNLIKQKFDYFRVPVIHQGDLNFRTKTFGSGMLKYYGVWSHTNVGFRNQDVDSLNMKDAFSLQNLNIYQNLSWKQKLGSGWLMNASSSYTNNKDNIEVELQDANNQQQFINNDPLYAQKNFKVNNKGNYANGKIVLDKRIGGINVIRFGGEYNYSNEKNEYIQYDGMHFFRNLNETILSAFAETDIYLTKDFAAKIGVRTEHSAMLQKWNIAPRISLAYQFPNKGQVSAAYGIFYQNPENKYLPSVDLLHFQKAT